MQHTIEMYPTGSKVNHNTNKMHDITHLAQTVKQFGAIRYAACYTNERHHIGAIKIPYQYCSNMRDAIPQLIKHV